MRQKKRVTVIWDVKIDQDISGLILSTQTIAPLSTVHNTM